MHIMLNLKAEVYGSGSQEKQQTTRFFGINSTRDGSSEEGIADWQKLLQGIVDIYNRILWKKTGGFLRIIDLLIKLAGMHSDHCGKRKKKMPVNGSFERCCNWSSALEKRQCLINCFRIQEILIKQKRMIKKAGGKSKWSALPDHRSGRKTCSDGGVSCCRMGKRHLICFLMKNNEFLNYLSGLAVDCHKDWTLSEVVMHAWLGGGLKWNWWASPPSQSWQFTCSQWMWGSYCTGWYNHTSSRQSILKILLEVAIRLHK